MNPRMEGFILGMTTLAIVVMLIGFWLERRKLKRDAERVRLAVQIIEQGKVSEIFDPRTGERVR